ncbi:MAG TPA: bifunctional proline dehydrogenase/L-glutamate gamma-semialdehyde dehydrogenase [Plantibacter sp.]|uniref:bifunctional proline dehydrogenase/L-glutamate gamma-semialdehyde dehydrogenase n=1 Tax=Plantibacter sp. TaxID=1871045 RepID=UPI002C7A4182|nr:bifunctional proline dehydrogenase/L-glutamate gamma-semialdehyde dehydrogenase [Plantibacter sp.]
MANPLDETSTASAALADRAIALAAAWVEAGAKAPADPAAERLASILRDPNGLSFALGFVDGVMRPGDRLVAGNTLHGIAQLAPAQLPWYQRAAIHAGGAIGPVMPWVVIPIARRVPHDMVGHLVVDGRPKQLTERIAALHEDGAALNLNLLGEAVLGEAEAAKRLEAIRELLERPDVNHLSIKVSSIVSQVSLWSFEQTVARVVRRLTPLFEAGLANGTFINLDLEEYRDLDLTIAVFTSLLDQPQLQRSSGGIAIQAYLPDALTAVMQLTAWSKQRVSAGGAPVAIRLVKGANLAMERVDAAIHGWPLAPYASKRDTDANLKRILGWSLTPEHTAFVRVGIASHNLFDIAYAWLLAGDRGVQDAITVEMLFGMATGQAAAIRQDVGQVLLYAPVVHPKEFDVAISYLARRLEENASQENFLSAAYELDAKPTLFARERRRFVASVQALEESAGLVPEPNRMQDRLAEAQEPVRLEPDTRFRDPADTETEGLTHQVLGLDRGSSGDGFIAQSSSGYVETAVFARSERGGVIDGAPGFANTPDTDPSLAANRLWTRQILERIPGSTVGHAGVAAAAIGDVRVLERAIAMVVASGSRWGARSVAERAAVLHAAGRVLSSRRGKLIEVLASEVGTTIADADTEVSEAVDLAHYAAVSAHELDRVQGARFVPSRLVVVTPPAQSPLSTAAAGVLNALATGSGVILAPSSLGRRSAAVLAEALWDAGVPRDLLVLADLADVELMKHLVSHPDVDRVVLTGSFETAGLYREWRADVPLLAATAGTNSIIVMPSADIDLAVADIVRSAFGNAGQQRSGASLVILVGSMGRSERFRRQLADAVRSLRVGWPADARTQLGPLLEPAAAGLLAGLTELRLGEHWLVEPKLLDDSSVNFGEPSRRLWSPGVRAGVQPGSPFHLAEIAGPVLGVMHAQTLGEAIGFQNAPAGIVTAGIHSLDAVDVGEWLDVVQAGNLYVNRSITGEIVQRQPFGGWKRAALGGVTKTGGPNALAVLGDWLPEEGSASRTLHLRGLDTRIVKLIEAAQPSLTYEAFDVLRRAALSDAVAWGNEFGEVKDVSQLGVERNLQRYRPVGVAVRIAAGADLGDALRVLIAAVRSRSRFTVSLGGRLPREVRDWLTSLQVAVSLETDDQWLARMAARGAIDGAEGFSAGAASLTLEDIGASRGGADVVSRVRIVGPRREPELVTVPGGVEALRPVREPLAARLAEALDGDPEVAIFAGPVTQAGRVELLPFLREQSISITAHRFGQPDTWSQSII